MKAGDKSLADPIGRAAASAPGGGLQWLGRPRYLTGSHYRQVHIVHRTIGLN
jgi:hypothetical protein